MFVLRLCERMQVCVCAWMCECVYVYLHAPARAGRRTSGWAGKQSCMYGGGGGAAGRGDASVVATALPLPIVLLKCLPRCAPGPALPHPTLLPSTRGVWSVAQRDPSTAHIAVTLWSVAQRPAKPFAETQ